MRRRPNQANQEGGVVECHKQDRDGAGNDPESIHDKNADIGQTRQLPTDKRRRGRIGGLVQRLAHGGRVQRHFSNNLVGKPFSKNIDRVAELAKQLKQLTQEPEDADADEDPADKCLARHADSEPNTVDQKHRATGAKRAPGAAPTCARRNKATRYRTHSQN
ncbi:hypothetical protein ERJ75_001094700 [Trypanosoma vivax]|nr:hypothetical protein ERJ75_001094700 [Trypanosoma vivax]